MPKSYLEPGEIDLLEKAAINLRDRLLIRVLFHVGCRVSEGLRLEDKNVDFERANITIQHLKLRIQMSCPRCGTRLAKSYTFCPKCSEKVEEAVAKEQEHRRVRTLPLDKETMEMLKDYVRRGGPIKCGDKELLLPINRHRSWQIVRDCAERAGLPKLVNPETGRVHNVSPHRLRDAFAVNALKKDDSGEGQRFLQKHLGHASFNTTAKYRKVAGEELKDWYDKLWKDSDGS